MLTLVIQNHPHSALADLGRKFVPRLGHHDIHPLTSWSLRQSRGGSRGSSPAIPLPSNLPRPDILQGGIEWVGTVKSRRCGGMWDTMQTKFQPTIHGGLLEDLAQARSPLASEVLSMSAAAAGHGAYLLVTDLALLREFMSYHVWCVWDFMCLAKSVQVGVGCYSLPWIPPANTGAVSIMTDIIRNEESDTGPEGYPSSHFEIYLSAMSEVGANTDCITYFLDLIKKGTPIFTAMEEAGADTSSINFVSKTLDFCIRPVHERIAAFSLGREELVPRMLTTFMRNIAKTNANAKTFRWYLRRHIELDTGSHAPLSAQLFRSIVGDDQILWDEALRSGLEAIRARCDYLDAIADRLKNLGQPRSKEETESSKRTLP